MEAQGIFVNILGFYWNKNCSMNLANAKQRFSKDEAGFNQLLEMEIIKVDENQNIMINFLDEQMNEFVDVSEKRAKAGKKGGLAKAKQMPGFAKAKRSNKEKIKEDKDKNIYTPKDLEMVTAYFKEIYSPRFIINDSPSTIFAIIFNNIISNLRILSLAKFSSVT